MSSKLASGLWLLVVLLNIKDFSDCCTDSEIISGCRIEKSVTGSAGWECLCGIGCEREFPFKTRTECETKLKAGKAFEDQCSAKPCKNGGECIQIKYGRYKCDCQGTKYYGENCESECPKSIRPSTTSPRPLQFPSDCIEI